MNEQMMLRAVKAIERIGMVLGGLYADQQLNDDQGIKALRLKRCGFGNAEIAEILGTTSNTIKSSLYTQKNKGRKKATHKRAKKTSMKRNR